MRTLRRRVLSLALLSAAAFSISYAVAQAGDDDRGRRGAVVPGVTPRPVSNDAPPRVGELGPAAPLPGLRPPRKVVVPAPPPAPKRVVPAPTPDPVTPSPAPVTPAPRQITPTPAPAPQPKPPSKKFKSIG